VWAVFAESGDAADGEEITNEILKDWGSLKANRSAPQMCPIGADFKHFLQAKTLE
jgi:hypothetical protein